MAGAELLFDLVGRHVLQLVHQLLDVYLFYLQDVGQVLVDVVSFLRGSVPDLLLRVNAGVLKQVGLLDKDGVNIQGVGRVQPPTTLGLVLALRQQAHHLFLRAKFAVVRFRGAFFNHKLFGESHFSSPGAALVVELLARLLFVQVAI